jgi:hypothetical protein
MGILAKLGRNEYPALAIDLNFMRTANEKHLESLSRRVEAPALADLADKLGPLTGGKQRKATLLLVNPVGNDQAFMTVALQHLAEAGRNANPSLFVGRMVESSAEHRNSPPVLHNIPLTPTTVKSIDACSMMKVNDIGAEYLETNKKRNSLRS